MSTSIPRRIFSFVRRRDRELIFGFLALFAFSDRSYGFWNLIIFAAAVLVGRLTRTTLLISVLRIILMGSLLGVLTFLEKYIEPGVVRRKIRDFPRHKGSVRRAYLAKVSLTGPDGLDIYLMEITADENPRVKRHNGVLYLVNVQANWRCVRRKQKGVVNFDAPIKRNKLVLGVRTIDPGSPREIRDAVEINLNRRLTLGQFWKLSGGKKQRAETRPQIQSDLEKAIASIPEPQMRAQASTICAGMMDSAQSITSTRRRLAKLLHPDRCRTFDSTAIFARINAALDDAQLATG